MAINTYILLLITSIIITHCTIVRDEGALLLQIVKTVVLLLWYKVVVLLVYSSRTCKHFVGAVVSVEEMEECPAKFEV